MMVRVVINWLMIGRYGKGASICWAVFEMTVKEVVRLGRNHASILDSSFIIVETDEYS